MNFVRITTFAALSLFTAPVMAADVTLCAGTPGRNYDSVMKGIASQLQTQGHNVNILNLGGSEDILNALDSGKCSYGPAQKDVHYNMSKKNAGLSGSVTPIALLYNEVMTMFCSADSGIDELSDVNSDTKVIIDKIGSGSALTWETMVAIEKEFGNGSSWINASVEYSPLDEAMATISLGNADCAFGVGAVPSNWAKQLEENGATLAWIYDKDLNDLMVGKSSLYPYQRVKAGPYSYKFDTYLVPAILFRSSKINLPDVDSIVKRVAPSIGQKYNTVK